MLNVRHSIVSEISVSTQVLHHSRAAGSKYLLQGQLTLEYIQIVHISHKIQMSAGLSGFFCQCERGIQLICKFFHHAETC